MEFIVNDEKSLIEAAKALGYSVMKNEPLIHIDLCKECGRKPQHIYSRNWTDKGYEFGIALRCKSCGKEAKRIFVTEKQHGMPKKKEENEVRELWNNKNKENKNE